MKIIRNITRLNDLNKQFVVTIGNFDGVHLGHQKILSILIAKAKELCLPSCVIIFEPQPQEFFKRERYLGRLTSLAEKLILLKNFGVDMVCCLRFDEMLSQLNEYEFIEKILKNKLRCKYVVIGDDFHFGANGRGDALFFRKYGAQNNFVVEILPPVVLNNERISSSLIRRFLIIGEMQRVAELLGRPYSATGRVVHGRAVATSLGFPTANVNLPHKELSFTGVFLVRIRGLAGAEINYGVANVGFRPTFAGEKKNLEVFIFNFNKNIYQFKITVEFLQKIRDEKKFASIDLLKRQVASDVMIAHDLLQDITS